MSQNSHGSTEGGYYVSFGSAEDQAGLSEAINNAVGSYFSRSQGGSSSASGGHTSCLEDPFFSENWVMGTSSHAEIMAICDKMYYGSSMVRNMIDLMSDFTAQGIRISHPDRDSQILLNKWFKKVNGPSVSERFCNYLYRFANNFIKRRTEELKNVLKNNRSIKKIPVSYYFINPKIVEHNGDSFFVGKVASYRIQVKDREDFLESASFKLLPSKIQQSILEEGNIPLNKDNDLIFFYKRDDWKAFAVPLLFSLWSDFQMIKKLERSDRAALDGAISNIRLFKLGSLDHKLMPGPAAFSKLADILEENPQGGTIDIMWGPDIEIVEIKSELYKYLDPRKYEHHMKKIYQGLGIPTTLAGGDPSGATNNTISLSVLINRLDYGRSVLESFWNSEIEQVSKALGLEPGGRLEFALASLTDDNAFKMLLIQMADRNLISEEMLQRSFKHDPEMEQIRIRKEERERKEGERGQKNAPFYRPTFEQELLKAAISAGWITPEEMGLEVPDFEEIKQGGLKTGRPPFSKDKEPRIRKDFTQNSSASLERQFWAAWAHGKITDWVKPRILRHFNKASLRALSSEEFRRYEAVKFSILYNLPYKQNLTEQDFAEAAVKPVCKDLYKRYQSTCRRLEESLDRDLTQNERVHVQSVLFALK